MEGTGDETQSNNTAGKNIKVVIKRRGSEKNGDPVKYDEDKSSYYGTT
jgi:hypothetical protein